MTVAVTVVAAKTSTGNQDITTTDLGGETPKGVLFFYSRGATDGDITANSGLSYGGTDGTNQFAVANFIKDGVTTFDSVTSMGDVHKTSKCIVALKATSAIVVHSEAAFDSFITNGVRVNWTTAGAEGWLVTAVFFSGSDWDVKVGTTQSVSNASVSLGWMPTAVLFFGRGDTANNTIQGGSRARSSAGGNGWNVSGVNSGAAAVTWAWSVTCQRVDWLSAANGNGGGGQFEVGSAGVYSVTADRTSTTWFFAPTFMEPDDWSYMALRWAGRYAQAGVLTLAAATGNQAFTGFGLQPELAILFPGENTDLSPGFARGSGIAALTATKVGGLAMSGRSSSGGPSGSIPTIEHSVAFEDAIRVLDSAGVEAAVATLVSLDAEGITLNFSNAPDVGWLWPYLAFGPAGGTERTFGWIID